MLAYAKNGFTILCLMYYVLIYKFKLIKMLNDDDKFNYMFNVNGMLKIYSVAMYLICFFI